MAKEKASPAQVRDAGTSGAAGPGHGAGCGTARGNGYSRLRAPDPDRSAEGGICLDRGAPGGVAAAMGRLVVDALRRKGAAGRTRAALPDLSAPLSGEQGADRVWHRSSTRLLQRGSRPWRGRCPRRGGAATPPGYFWPEEGTAGCPGVTAEDTITMDLRPTPCYQTAEFSQETVQCPPMAPQFR